MAIIGINPTDFAPRKRTALDSIAIGVDVASKILGGAAAGAGAYSELFGPKADLYKSEVKKNEALARADKQKQNPLLSPAIEGLTKSNLIVTSEQDPDANKKITDLPGYVDPENNPIPVYVKPAPVNEEEAAKQEDAIQSEIDKKQEVVDFKDVYAAANQAAKSLSQKPTRASDMLLLGNFIKMLQPSARFNAGNVEGVSAQVGTVLGDAALLYKKLYSDEAGLLHDNERKDVVNAIRAQYDATREPYDRAWDQIEVKARNRKIKNMPSRYPQIDFSALGKALPNTQQTPKREISPKANDQLLFELNGGQ